MDAVDPNMNRFTEYECKKEDLTPIAGYWACPLVSLEDALEKVSSQIEQLGRSIKTAKDFCHYPSEHHLTHDEAASIFLYTMEAGDHSFYRILLREEDRKTIIPWFSYLKLFDTALNKLPTVKGILWRGLSGNVTSSYKENQRFTWWSVSSCSLSTRVVQGFLKSDQNSTLFMIEAVNGKDLVSYTNFPKEAEVILKLGTRLCMKGNAFKFNNLQIIHLKEIDDNKIREQANQPLAESWSDAFFSSHSPSTG